VGSVVTASSPPTVGQIVGPGGCEGGDGLDAEGVAPSGDVHDRVPLSSDEVKIMHGVLDLR
jgi:hypothetical protein